ncbi:hypothetical protein EJB05_05677, partial [Eragrostis curvula]
MDWNKKEKQSPIHPTTTKNGKNKPRMEALQDKILCLDDPAQPFAWLPWVLAFNAGCRHEMEAAAGVGDTVGLMTRVIGELQRGAGLLGWAEMLCCFEPARVVERGDGEKSGSLGISGTGAPEAASQINAWVEKITSGLIKELLSPDSIDQTTRLIIGNALYFKGVWTEKFDASKTKDCQFHLHDGSSVQAPFMSSTRPQYVASYDNLKVLKLPYQQGGDTRQFSMYILLPEAQDGLWSLAEKAHPNAEGFSWAVTESPWISWQLSSEPEFLEKHIPVRKVVVGQLNVPKFKISFGFDASNLLKGLGLHLLFSAKADFHNWSIHQRRRACVFHQLFTIDEEGTEAAAACAIITKRCYRKPMDFMADHPFIFLIREDPTGAVLFMGLVVNPLIAP